METIELKIDPDAHGAELRRKQVELVNLLPSFMDAKDRLNVIVSARKERISDMEAEATRDIIKTDEFKASKSIVQSKVLAAMMREWDIEIDYNEALDKNTQGEVKGEGDEAKVVVTNLSIENHLLQLDMYRFNKSKSQVDAILQLLWVCRSILSFDKEELQHLSGV